MRPKAGEVGTRGDIARECWQPLQDAVCKTRVQRKSPDNALLEEREQRHVPRRRSGFLPAIDGRLERAMVCALDRSELAGCCRDLRVRCRQRDQQPDQDSVADAELCRMCEDHGYPRIRVGYEGDRARWGSSGGRLPESPRNRVHVGKGLVGREVLGLR